MFKMFAWRRESTGQTVAACGRDKFEACETLCNAYDGDEKAEDFTLLASGGEEVMEMILGEFGGVVVLRDTLDA